MTSRLVLSLYYRSYLHQIRNGSAKVCEVEMVGEECEVKMVDEEWPVGRGEVKTLVVVSSVTGVYNGDIWW